jgi:hypothetical protein
MNIATPKEILLKSLKKIKTSFKNGGLIWWTTKKNIWNG